MHISNLPNIGPYIKQTKNNTKNKAVYHNTVKTKKRKKLNQKKENRTPTPCVHTQNLSIYSIYPLTHTS